MTPLARFFAFLSLPVLLMLSACGTQTEIQPPAVEHETGFVFHVDPEREIVTLIETPALESLHAPSYRPSDTRILAPSEEITLRNLSYRFLSGNRFVMRTRIKNVTEGLTFEQPFFFTLNEDSARIKSATAPLVTDRDLGGDGVLSPGERTRRFTFEVKHKGRSFTFLVDASAVVTTEAVGKIAFASNRDGNEEIYVVNADGTSLTNLTNHPAVDGAPHWSPDGTQILYLSYWDSRPEIFVMNADGSDQTNLTNTPEEEDFPVWSPDGSRVAFMRFRDGFGVYDIYVMNADGSDPINLTDLNGLPPDPFGPVAWSPDGSKIAFAALPLEIYVMNADGSNPVNLTDHPAFDFWPVWSPDGNQIAFLSDRDGNEEIYVMNSDGSDPTNLTRNPTRDYEPTWSPDGSRIAFTSYRDGNREIYVMNADGGNPTNLTGNLAEDFEPVWSPDGSRMAFRSGRDGNWEIYVMNADGTDQTNLTNHPARDTLPAWQPVAR